MCAWYRNREIASLQFDGAVIKTAQSENRDLNSGGETPQGTLRMCLRFEITNRNFGIKTVEVLSFREKQVKNPRPIRGTVRNYQPKYLCVPSSSKPRNPTSQRKMKNETKYDAIATFEERILTFNPT
ncbi:hypothetical protein K0M31_020270 [Melipona bicolor]|uniref:Uncharacterized protein n=1 Tax=Melipona bicolor TaxID=60889 RepID=A0AA40G189_9HYME|nr:hypothetical protein K0M31_020270 [Melipona bicolor]